MAESLLAALPRTVARLLRLGAIPHWLDADLIALLLEPGEMETAVFQTYLANLRFVRLDEQGRYHFHNSVRRHLHSWWQRENPQVYQQTHERLWRHFMRRAETAVPPDRAIYQTEALYHQLYAAEDAGLQTLQTLFESACDRYRHGEAEHLLAYALEVQTHLTMEGQEWVRFFQARLAHLYGQEAANAEMIFVALQQHATQPTLRAAAGWSLGQVRVNQQHWSDAVTLFKTSLSELPSEENAYRARIMLAVGNAYRDLGENSGMDYPIEAQRLSRLNSLLHGLQHLPFLLYEALVRRVSFLPTWYFGTNYQDWIVAHLFIQAGQWYRAAGELLRQTGDAYNIADVILLQAELDFKLGRWSRAGEKHAQLQASPAVRESIYRKARLQLSQGELALAQGKLALAGQQLAQAYATFQRFGDHLASGRTADLLAQLHRAQGDWQQVTQEQIASLHAFTAANDQLLQTRTLWALQALSQRPELDAARGEIQEAMAQVTTRHYITRFPKQLLRWYQRLAVLGALPLWYVLAFVISILLTMGLAYVESQFVLPNVQEEGLIFSELTTLLLGVVSPILITLWLYRLIYVLMGTAVVWGLGRKLVRIEEDQPTYFATTPEGIMIQKHKQEPRFVAWTAVTDVAWVDYRQRQRPIKLISNSYLLSGGDAYVRISGTTVGYTRWQEDVRQRLAATSPAPTERRLTLTIFQLWAVGTAVFLAFLIALSMVGDHFISFQVEPIQDSPSSSLFQIIPNSPASGGTELPLSALIVGFAPNLLLIFPAITLWRLAFQRRRVARLVPQQTAPLPQWLLWLAAVAVTLLTLFWSLIIILFA